MKFILIQTLSLMFMLPVLSFSVLANSEDSEPLSFQIVDEQQNSIAGAKVEIISHVQSLDETIAVSDENGSITLSRNLSENEYLTVSSEKHITATFDSVPVFKLILQNKPLETNIELKGKTENYGNLKRDGKVDFSLVIPALKKRQLLNFDLSMIISPEEDLITVIGKEFGIPSNISLPKQRESYIFPITLNKPEYRVYGRKPGEYNVTAIHGQFPLKQVIDTFRNGESLFNVVNLFNFIGGGQNLVTTDESVENLNITIDEMKFDLEKNIQAPVYDNKNYVMLTLALSEKNQWLFPTDIKKIEESGIATLKFPQDNEKNYFLSALTKQLPENPEQTPESFQQLTFKLDDADAPAVTPFLDFINEPILTEKQLTMTPPNTIQGILPVATYISLSKVIKKKVSKVETELKTTLWEQTLNGWVASIDLPDLKLEKEESVIYRWEVMYIGNSKNSPTDLSAHEAIENATHITRNATQL